MKWKESGNNRLPMTAKEIEKLADFIAERLWQRHNETTDLVGVKEAGKITGLSVQSLYNRKNEIGYLKRGKSLMFSRKNLEAYNKGREHQ